MDLGRRGFLGALLAGAVLDPEKLLWRQGEKLISIPAPRALPDLYDLEYYYYYTLDSMTRIWVPTGRRIFVRSASGSNPFRIDALPGAIQPGPHTQK